MLLVYLQAISLITPEQIFSTTEMDPGWMHDIVKYLKAGELPEDEKHAHKRYPPIPRVPSEVLNPVINPWLFTQWGMDTVGPLPVAATQNKFMLVAIFQQGQWRLQVFLEEHRMPVRSPQAIVANNGPQFDNIAFRTFCTELNIKNLYSTPYYPQSNGQAETTNKTLLTALKKRLE
ncbi:hypothetical protein CK203_110255 [Vitis vinifera]|uniref:Integrase catalytic domain-containing protein n=1 Tax=Vitis vinifera TaxID=29760 RepID=A0A438CFI2_VITVI|nr:hypothetical protein CK203_110255 [Vitis vinifera]